MEVTRTKRAPRSPNYPGIDLQAAIQRAKAMFDNEGRSTVPDDAVIEDWGYTSRSGRALSALAALKSFALLETVERGQVRLSDLALTILLNDVTSPERREALKIAAVAPGIHQDVMAQFPHGLPSDATLRVYLVRDKSFSDPGANDLIREMRASFDYAGVTTFDQDLRDESENSDDDVERDKQDQDEVREDRSPEPERRPRAKDPGVTTIPVLLPGGEKVTIEGRFPITEAAWKQMMAVLEAMKLGMVKDEAPEGWQLEDGPPEPD